MRGRTFNFLEHGSHSLGAALAGHLDVEYSGLDAPKVKDEVRSQNVARLGPLVGTWDRHCAVKRAFNEVVRTVVAI